MTDQHPITPPPELVQQWCDEDPGGFEMFDRLATKAARWGADQELEACVEWLEDADLDDSQKVSWVNLRAARRPKPPTLKEQALDALREAESTGCLYVNGRSDLIRKALEALP
jgi:hypothetical protein